MRLTRFIAAAAALIGGLFAFWLVRSAEPETAPVEQAAPAASAAVLEDELLAADRAFAADTARDGIDGWMSWMARDAARIPVLGADLVAGHEAIRRLDAPSFERDDLRLQWTPAQAHAFADGRHGLTTGPYEVVSTEDGTTLDTGHYVTWWRRDVDGWRVIFDTGAHDPN